MAAADIADIINLDRYPFHQPDNPASQRLLDAGRSALEDAALFQLPGFVREDAVSAMAAELEARVPVAVRYDQPRNAFDVYDDSYPADHPRNMMHPCRYHQVLNYQIPNDSLLRRVYTWPPLTAFLRCVAGYETFHRSECPHLALSSKIAGNGDTDGWHFDTNDIVFSLLLQAPQAGGAFEYMPYIRDPATDDFAIVADALQEPDRHVRKAPIAPGDLTCFKGDESLHRVTPVEGNKRRIVALFCYDREPGTTFSQAYIEELTAGLPA